MDRSHFVFCLPLAIVALGGSLFGCSDARALPPPAPLSAAPRENPVVPPSLTSSPHRPAEDPFAALATHAPSPSPGPEVAPLRPADSAPLLRRLPPLTSPASVPRSYGAVESAAQWDPAMQALIDQTGTRRSLKWDRSSGSEATLLRRLPPAPEASSTGARQALEGTYSVMKRPGPATEPPAPVQIDANTPVRALTPELAPIGQAEVRPSEPTRAEPTLAAPRTAEPVQVHRAPAGTMRPEPALAPALNAPARRFSATSEPELPSAPSSAPISSTPSSSFQVIRRQPPTDSTATAPITSADRVTSSSVRSPAGERTDLPKTDSAAMQAVVVRAEALVQNGVQLAERRAYYSARAEFIQALQLVAQALDGQTGNEDHVQHLANGLRALQEADDFQPEGSRLQADLRVERIVLAHRTPILKEPQKPISTLEALQRYFTYAQEELAAAGGQQPTASRALYNLGKLHMVLAAESSRARDLHGPKAIALQQSALMVDPNNYLAANELGVLLARYGQLEDARRALEHATKLAPLPEAWQNLATVQHQLGNQEAAHQAQLTYQQLVHQQQLAQAGTSAVAVEWIAPQQFARLHQETPPLQAAPATQPPHDTARRILPGFSR